MPAGSMEVGECLLLYCFIYISCMRRLFYAEIPPTFVLERLLSLVKIALIANRVFFKTLPRSVKTSFMTKDHGQGVLKRKNY